MRSNLRHLFRSATLVLLIVGFSLRPAHAGEAHIAVAANFKPALDHLETAFEEQSGHRLIVTSGSTGKLYAQIKNGAPFDVFLAADEARPQKLETGGDAVARITYAVGQLALWEPGAAETGPHRLASPDYRRVAMANPELAPYGLAAQQVVERLGVGDATNARRVFGENVAQAFSFVRTGNAELGFVSLSLVLSVPAEERGAYWTPAQAHYDPVRQDAVLLTRGAENTAAIAFMEFLQSDAAIAIVTENGYIAP